MTDEEQAFWDTMLVIFLGIVAGIVCLAHAGQP